MSLNETRIDIPAEHVSNIFGQFDHNIKLIERTLNVTVVPRNEGIKVIGDTANVEGACKVFLFPDCRRLTVQDQNVLLKLVEEGPGYAAFLFCAENPGVLLPTVRSRCVELAVRPTGEENIQLLPQARTLLEAMAGGERQDMIRALVGLENGKITREALQQVRAGAQQALRLRYGVPAEEPYAAAAGPLSRRLGEKQLMELCEMLGRFAQECEWNVAVGQVLGAIAAEWEETL